MFLRSLAVIASLLVMSTAQAQTFPNPNVRVSVAGVSGAGCPTGSVRATLSPDNSTVSVLFDRFITEIPANSEQKRVRLLCQVRLNFHFYGQNRIAVVGSDLRGFVSIPQNASTTFQVQHYSPFTMNPKVLQDMNLTQKYTGPVSEDVMLQSQFTKKPLWSHCGTQGGWQGQPLMNIWITIDSENYSTDEDLISGVDTLDVNASASLKYHIIWKQDTKNCPR